MGCASCKPRSRACEEELGDGEMPRRNMVPLSEQQSEIKKQLLQADPERTTSQEPSAPPAVNSTPHGVGPPGYHLRKGIATARVHLGDSERVHDKYELTDKILGTGVSGIVRVGLDRNTGTRVAIKTLCLENISAKKAAMLHNEVDVYLKLDHPNIAKLIEVFEDSKYIYVVMELCTGGELYDRLAARKRYSELDAAKVTRQMLEAISYCHEHRICHRDLKLENWVYSDRSDDADLKLIDFGFSRIFSPVVPMTAMHGTVYYVSPEVMDGCYREKCDIWSIGIIVYMLLSGTPPFNGSADYQILLKIRNAQYDFNLPVWQTISATAKDFISHLLVKDPTQRPSAKQALEHPWLQINADNENRAELKDNEISSDVLQSMKEFAESNVLKRAAMSLVAFSFTSNDLHNLQKQFRTLDQNNTGTIKLQDFVKAVTDKLKISPEEAESIFHRIDYDSNGKEVPYTLFLAATLHAKLATDEHWVREAFDLLDADHSGRITVQDLKNVLGNSFAQVPVEEILTQYRESGLDFQAFRGLLLNQEASSAFPIETRASFSNAVVEMQLKRAI